MRNAAIEYTATAKTEYTVNTNPCFFSPSKKNGMLSINRKKVRLRKCGVTWNSNMLVPEKPLSIRLTGIRNMVTPIALTEPLIKSPRKLSGRRVRSDRICSLTVALFIKLNIPQPTQKIK